MALRIRKSGKILCAAMHSYEDDDEFYIPDDIHYYLSVIKKVLVTEPMEKHKVHGEWWFKDEVPNNVKIEEFYLK